MSMCNNRIQTKVTTWTNYDHAEIDKWSESNIAVYKSTNQLCNWSNQIIRNNDISCILSTHISQHPVKLAFTKRVLRLANYRGIIYILNILRISSQPLWKGNICEEQGQYQCCWWPGYLHHQAISRHGNVRGYPGLPWQQILITCDISIWRNDMKCQYNFMFSGWKKVAQELILQ